MRGVSQTRPIPATIGTLFGGLWALIAAMALPSGWRLPIAALVASATAILVARLWRASQRASGSAERLFGRKAYQIAVCAEVVAICTASAILPVFGWQAYFIQVVGVIAGLHFIGLWAATRSMRFLRIAGGMCAISATAILLPATLHLLNLREIFTGLGNALVLWLGAGRSLETQT
jgi:hypothetical protein